MSELFWL
jgi:putative transposase